MYLHLVVLSIIVIVCWGDVLNITYKYIFMTVVTFGLGLEVRLFINSLLNLFWPLEVSLFTSSDQKLHDAPQCPSRVAYPNTASPVPTRIAQSALFVSTLTFPQLVHDWVNKGLGMSSRVCAIGLIQDPVPLIENSVPLVGFLLVSFIK